MENDETTVLKPLRLQLTWHHLVGQNSSFTSYVGPNQIMAMHIFTRSSQWNTKHTFNIFIVKNHITFLFTKHIFNEKGNGKRN